jgi:hypothetical protein
MAKLSRPPDNTNYHDKNSEKKEEEEEEEGMYSVYFSLKKHSFDGVIPES